MVGGRRSTKLVRVHPAFPRTWPVGGPLPCTSHFIIDFCTMRWRGNGRRKRDARSHLSNAGIRFYTSITPFLGNSFFYFSYRDRTDVLKKYFISGIHGRFQSITSCLIKRASVFSSPAEQSRRLSGKALAFPLPFLATQHSHGLPKAVLLTFLSKTASDTPDRLVPRCQARHRHCRPLPHIQSPFVPDCRTCCRETQRHPSWHSLTRRHQISKQRVYK